MAAVITIAITLIAGAALFGFVNGLATSSENKLGDSAANNANSLGEEFVVVDMSYSVSPAGGDAVILWIYNSGSVTLQISGIQLYNSSSNIGDPGLYALFYANSSVTTAGASPCGSPLDPYGGLTNYRPLSSLSVPPHSNPFQLILNLPTGCLQPGTTYDVMVVGLYGNPVLYYSSYEGGS